MKDQIELQNLRCQQSNCCTLEEHALFVVCHSRHVRLVGPVIFAKAIDLVVLAPRFQKQPVCTLCAVFADQLLAFKAAALVAQHRGALRVIVCTAVPVERLVAAATEEGLFVLCDALAALLIFLAIRAVGA